MDLNNSNNQNSNPDKEFIQAAYITVMFLIDHFNCVKNELKIDYESFIILQVVNSHWLYYKKKDEKITWGETWKKIGANDAEKTLQKKKLSILAISQILKLPQETCRRKIQNFLKKKILKKTTESGIVMGENFVDFHQKYSAKFAHSVSKFILSLSELEKKFFENLLKIQT